MTRISRSVAHRYAAAKDKKRRKDTPRVPVRSTRLAEAAATAEPPSAEAAPAPQSAASEAPATRLAAARPAAPRRATSDYTQHYSYVWSDIRRIGIVAGGLLAGLVALSFVIQ